MNMLFQLMRAVAVVCLFVSASFGQAVSCPQFQHDNGAGACEFNNYLDTPGYLAAQNRAVADSLNASPNGPGAVFARQYGSLPQNQQSAIFSCQIAIFNAEYFVGFTVPQSCGTNGKLDAAKIIAANPAATNPSNAPSVVWNAAANRFDPAAPPQPGPAAPIVTVPAPSGTNLVGQLAFGSTFLPGPGAMKDSRTPNVTDGQVVSQAGVSYTAHVVQGMMGISVYFTRP